MSISSKARRNASGNAKGVTLVELLVVLTVLGIIMGLIYSIFISQIQTSGWRGQVAERKQNIDGALNVMVSDLIQAESVFYNSTTTTPPSIFNTCDDGISVSTTSTDRITFYRNNDQLMRYDSNSGQTRTVAENITDLSLQCYNESGLAMNTPMNPGDEARISRVEISVTGKTERPSPVTKADSYQTYKASVQLRNKPNFSGSGCGVVYFTISDSNVQFCNPPGEQPTLEVYLCSLIGNALGGQVKIYPKEGLPVSLVGINGTTVTINSENVAVMNIPDPASNAMCKDPGTGGQALVYASQADASSSDLAPGTSLELLAVWEDVVRQCAVSTSRSFIVNAGDPNEFTNDALGVTYTGGNITACQGSVTADLNATVKDACGHGLAGVDVVFNVIDANGTVMTGNPQWGNISGTVYEGEGTYSAVYNAGNLAQSVTVNATSVDIVNSANAEVTNSISLPPGDPDHLAYYSPADGDSLHVVNCLNNEATAIFEVRDACDNLVVADQTDKLTAYTSTLWTPAAPGLPGGVGNVTSAGNNRYSVKYTTSSTTCGKDDAGYIYIDHADIVNGTYDLDIPLDISYCDYPGVNVWLSNSIIAAGCSDESVQVNAQVLGKDPTNGNCTLETATTDITLKVANNRGGVLLTNYGLTTGDNGRFLADNGDIINATASREIHPLGLAIGTADLIAWDAKPGDQLRVEATAIIPDYGNVTYGPDYTELLDVVSDKADVKFYDSAYDSQALYYDVPQLVPTPQLGSAYLQIRDCDQNGDNSSVDFINATVASDNTRFGDTSLTVQLMETNASSGIFQATVPLHRQDIGGTLKVDKGAFLTADYTDPDDPTDVASSDPVPLTGCRELTFTDDVGNVKNAVSPDPYPYGDGSGTLSEGDSSFRMVANVPSFAVQPGETGGAVQICSSVDNNTVVLKKLDLEPGLLMINGPDLGGNHKKDYVYVGLDDYSHGNTELTDPSPGGDTNLGVIVINSPGTLRIAAPATALDCSGDLENDEDVVNYGCYEELALNDVQAPRVTLTLPIDDPLQGVVGIDADFNDTPGTIKHAVVEMKCVASNPGGCTPGTTYDDLYNVVFPPSPPTYHVNPTINVDTSGYPNGTYEFKAYATDYAGITGASEIQTRDIDNSCEITDFGITRSGDTISVSGYYKLNGFPTAASIDLTVIDGNNVSTDHPVATTTPTGYFTWDSSPDPVVAAAMAIASGTHGLCTTADVTDQETCEISVISNSLSYEDGHVSANWQYLLDGSPFTADIMFANASSVSGTHEYYTENNVDTVNWTSTAVFNDDATLYLGGQYGQCLAITNGTTLKAPTCSVQIDSTSSNDVGTINVAWSYYLDGNPYIANVLAATADDGSSYDETTQFSLGSYSWTTTSAFTNTVTVDVSGQYGICNATATTDVEPPTCAINIINATSTDEGRISVDWEYLMNGSQHIADVMNASTSNATETADSTTVNNQPSYSWTTSEQYAEPVDLAIDGIYGVCYATNATTVGPPTCSIQNISKTANADGTITVGWDYYMNGALHTADTLFANASSATDPSESSSGSSASHYSFTTATRYTSDVTVDITSQYALCNATASVTVTPPAPTCSIQVNSATYDVSNGHVTVDWEYWLNGSAYVANTMSVSADDGLVSDGTTVNNQQNYTWTSTAAFTNDITVDLSGQYSTTCTATDTVTVKVPACTVNIDSATYDITDGDVTVDWSFVWNGTSVTADILNATASSSTEPDETFSIGSQSSYSWTTTTKPWTSDVTVEVGGEYGVCVAPKVSQVVTEPTCSVSITNSSSNDEGTVNAEWAFFVNSVSATADVLNATATDGVDNDSTSQTSLSSYAWTTTQSFANATTVEVGGHRGVCEASKQSTVVQPPTCSIKNISKTANADGTITVGWDYYMNSALHTADTLFANASSATDPSESSSATSANSHSFTTTTRYTSDVTVDITSQYGRCEATASVTVTPPAPTCTIQVNSATYDVSNGHVTVDWEYWLNGSAYVANTMSVSADDGLVSDGTTVNNQQNYTWTSTAAFTNDITVDLSGQYSTTCTATDTVTVTVPACTVSIGSATYDITDGDVTVDWSFVWNGTSVTADILNATASSSTEPDETFSIGSQSSYSWTTTTKPWTSDVTVEVGGEYGVCVAPKVSQVVGEPQCSVSITNSSSNDEGTMNVDWSFAVDNSPATADILNATATDGVDNDSTSQSGVGSYSWTTTQAFANAATMEVGGYKGVCVAPKQSTVVNVPTCSINVTNQTANADGTITVGWQFLMNGNPTPHPADTLFVNASSATDPSDSDSATNESTHSWTSGVRYTSDVTVDITSQYGRCEATKTVTITPPAPTCSINVIDSSYDVSNGHITVDWEYWLNGSAYVANTLDASADDGYVSDSTTVNELSSYSWTNTGAVFTNAITVDLSGQYSTTCTATDTLTVTVPACSVSITGSSYDITDGDVTVDWSFVWNGTSVTANILNAAASSSTEPTETFSVGSQSSYSWTTTTKPWTSDVTVDVAGQYGVCVADTKSVTIKEPSCYVDITGSSSNDESTMNVDWSFYVNDGVTNTLTTADILNATATDGVDSDSTSVPSVNSYSWTTTQAFANATTMEVGGYKGVCVAPKQSVVVNPPTCSVNIINATSNDEGTINVDWEYKMNGSQRIADVMNATTSNATETTDSVTANNVKTYSWTSTKQYANPVTVDVDGKYGICYATASTTVNPPTCSINVTEETVNQPIHTINIGWEYWMNGSSHVADSLFINADSATDPADSGSTTNVSSYTWTSSQIFTSPVTADITSQYGVCNATGTANVDPGATTCSIQVNSATYDVSDGSVTVDWDYLLNGTPYVANTLSVSADDGYISDGATFNDIGSKVWTSSGGFTNDVTVDLSGTYSTVCTATRTVIVSVPSCSVSIDGSSYDITDGDVTVDWSFVWNGTSVTADILNAAASSSTEPTETFSVPSQSSYSWTTTTKPWTSDVTVDVAGQYGVCVAGTKSVTIPEPQCSVTITNSSSNDEGTMNVDWSFYVDDGVTNSLTTADILNATATDGVDSDSTTQNNKNSYSWTTTQAFLNATTMEVGGYKGVCEAPKESVVVSPPTCSVNILNATSNDEGTVNVEWEYTMNGSQRIADVMNATTSNATETTDSVTANNVKTYLWTSTERYASPVTVDVTGIYGVCYSTDTTTVNPPACSIQNVAKSANADGTVNVSWDYYMNGALHQADTLFANVTSATDPSESSSATNANSHSFTTTTRYTSGVTVNISSQYGACEATKTVTVTPPVPKCSIAINSATYDVSDGSVTVDWEYWLNGSIYVADTMSASADDSLVTDSTTVNNLDSYSWTSSAAPFTKDVAVNLSGQYSTTCTAVNSVSITVPACSVNITGSSYDITDGDVTVDWDFIWNGVSTTANILNAAASSATEPTETFSVGGQSSYSWTTTTKPWTSDVTVDVAGQYGVCVASPDSVTITEPSCSVSIINSSSNDDGSLNVEWNYYVDYGAGNVLTTADVLNATASDGVDSDSTTQLNKSTYTWLTAQKFANDSTVAVGGTKGVCEAHSAPTVVAAPTCSIQNIVKSANADGTVNVSWDYYMNGALHTADTLDITVDSAADPAESDSATNASHHDFTSTVRYTSIVNATITSQYGLCEATKSVSITPPATSCQVVINDATYDVSNGHATVDWEFWLNGSAYIANSLTIDATDGYVADNNSYTDTQSDVWTTSAVFTNAIGVDISASYGTCNVNKSLPITVPACSVNITGSSYDITDGDVTVDWEFIWNGVSTTADILNAAASSSTEPDETTSVNNQSSYSWTTTTKPWTSDVTVDVAGQYGVCEAAQKSVVIPKPTCSVSIVNSSSNDDGSLNVEWNYYVDYGAGNVLTTADVLNAVASDGVTNDSTTQLNQSGYTWLTAQKFANDSTVAVGGVKGVCEAHSAPTVVAAPTCSIQNIVKSANADGTVNFSWDYYMNGALHTADTLDITVDSDADAAESASGTNASHYDFTSSTRYTSIVNATITSQYGLCAATKTPKPTVTPPATTCQILVNNAYYDVSDGSVTVDWEFQLNGSPYIANSLTIDASDGYVADNTSYTDTQSDVWTSSGVVFTNTISIDMSASYGTCNVNKSLPPISVPSCSVNITGSSYDITDGDVTVDWEFIWNGVSTTADILNAVASSSTEPDETFSVGSQSSYSWTTTTKPWNSDVTVEVAGQYGVCEAAPKSVVVKEPKCTLDNVSVAWDASDDGSLVVSWDYYLNDGVTNAITVADSLSGTADDGVNTQTVLVPSQSSYLWHTSQLFSNTVSVDLSGTLGVCTATYSTSLKRLECSATGGFYDSAYTATADYYDVPTAYVGGLFSPVDNYGYMSISDCDENKDRFNPDTVSVNVKSDYYTGSTVETEAVTLTETGNNTGIFRGPFTMTRNSVTTNNGVLTVYPGSKITSTYTDSDDLSPQILNKVVPLTGMRNMWLTNSSGVNIYTLYADGYPYDLSYPDGDSAFHINAEIPADANNGIQNSITVVACDYTFYKDKTVTLIEDASDNGIFTIDNVSPTYPVDYMYVGQDWTGTHTPAPGGDSNLGITMKYDYYAYLYYPDTGATCDISSDDRLNYGDYASIKTYVNDRSLSLNSYDSGYLASTQYAKDRGTGTDYYATYYSFTLSASTKVIIDVTSPLTNGVGVAGNPYVYLLDSGGSVIAEDDDSGVDTDSRIITTLAAGDYTIEITTNAQWQTMYYTVALNDIKSTIPIAPPDPDPTIGTIDGSTLSVSWPGNYATYYKFTSPGGVPFLIQLTGAGVSPITDPALVLLDSNWNVISGNDGGGSGTANILETLPAGDYIIEATTSSAETGTFGLSLAGIPPPAAVWNFDTGTLQGWTAGGTSGTGTSKWQVTTNRASSPLYSAYFGNTATWTFADGTYVVTGTLTSPPQALGASPAISFDYFLDGECTEGASCSYDHLTFEISTDGGTNWISLTGTSLADSSSFKTTYIDLSAYASKTVLFRFKFNTVDGAANNYEGAYVDSIKLY